MDLHDQVILCRKIVRLARKARGKAKIPARQPLARMYIDSPGWAHICPQLREHVRDECNVQRIITENQQSVT